MSAAPETDREKRRQRTLLVSLLVVIMAAGLYYWWSQAGSVAPASSPVTVTPAPAGTIAVPEPLRLDQLDALPADVEVGRNPFIYGTRPAPPAPPPGPYIPPSMTMPDLPPAPSGPPPISLRLTGMTVVAEGGRTMVTLRDPATNTLYQAFEGDIVDGRYRVVKVGVQSVVLSYVDGTGVRTIPLGG